MRPLLKPCSAAPGLLEGHLDYFCQQNVEIALPAPCSADQPAETGYVTNLDSIAIELAQGLQQASPPGFEDLKSACANLYPFWFRSERH